MLRRVNRARPTTIAKDGAPLYARSRFPEDDVMDNYLIAKPNRSALRKVAVHALHRHFPARLVRA
jgi:hypothetical protein